MTDEPYDAHDMFALMVETAEGHALSAQLTAFAKEVNLCAPENSDIVEKIASWFDQPDNDAFGVRDAVVFALCRWNPVPGYEHLALRAWRRGYRTLSFGDTARSITRCYRHSGQLSLSVVLEIVGPMLQAPPAARAVEADPCLQDVYVEFLEDCGLIIRHLHALLTKNDASVSDNWDTHRVTVDWKQVAEVLYMAAMLEPRT
jgi:hypothetical protein